MMSSVYKVFKGKKLNNDLFMLSYQQRQKKNTSDKSKFVGSAKKKVY